MVLSPKRKGTVTLRLVRKIDGTILAEQAVTIV